MDLPEEAIRSRPGEQPVRHPRFQIRLDRYEEAGMIRQIPRRNFLAPPLALAGCATASPCFYAKAATSSRRLVFANGGEPSTLEPTQLTGTNGDHIVATLLDPLTTLHPITNPLRPAGVAGTPSKSLFSRRRCRPGSKASTAKTIRLPAGRIMPGTWIRSGFSRA